MGAVTLRRLAFSIALLAGCGAQQGAPRRPRRSASATYPIGGVLQGLASGQSLIMQDNGGDKITLATNGAFVFPTQLAVGSSYKVEVNHQPSGQTCTVAWGLGTVSAAVSNVVVTCAATTVTVGGTVVGLSASGMKIQNTGEYDYGVDNLGPFTMSTRIALGAPYDVTVSQQPSGQTCVVTGGSGTATGNVTGAVVTCANGTGYPVGGTVTGLSGTLVLQDDGGDPVTLTSSGPFTFPTAVPSGQPYAVTVATQPAGESCTVANGSGTVSGPVSDVSVTCTGAATGGGAGPYTLGGTLQGLAAGESVIMQDNAGDKMTLAANGAFVFPTAVATGFSYKVEVNYQPSTQTCTVAYGLGTVAGPVSNVVVTCSDTLVTIGGTLIGLNGASGLQLSDATEDTFGIDDWEAWTFPNPVAYGSPYDVEIAQQPIGETCVVSNNTGVALGNVTDVVVDCGGASATPSYTVSGSVTGLLGDVTLLDNGSDSITLSADGSFTFATPIPAGDSYAVTIDTQPVGQTCVVTNDTGTPTANVTNVLVTCTGPGGGPFPIGGTLQGLAGGGSVVVQNSTGDKITLSANGVFTFPTELNYGDAYKVEVNQSPSGQTCTVAYGLGTSSGPVGNVVVTCAASTVTVGGTVTGLTGSGLKIQNTGEYDYGISNVGPFTMSTKIALGAPYDMTVSQQPQGQTCTVTGGSGVALGNVAGVSITCSP